MKGLMSTPANRSSAGAHMSVNALPLIGAVATPSPGSTRTFTDDGNRLSRVALNMSNEAFPAGTGGVSFGDPSSAKRFRNAALKPLRRLMRP